MIKFYFISVAKVLKLPDCDTTVQPCSIYLEKNYIIKSLVKYAVLKTYMFKHAQNGGSYYLTSPLLVGKGSLIAIYSDEVYYDTSLTGRYSDIQYTIKDSSYIQLTTTLKLKTQISSMNLIIFCIN